jgi:Helicase C-terminal domain/Type III restriction enzyme, res subunit
MPGAIDYSQLLGELESATFTDLRPAQVAALEAYVAEYTEAPDLAIELPTGAGKSLIALLIGEAWRREGKTVAVLTGNKTLARQMEREGRELGVPVVRFEGAGPTIPLPERRRYRRAQALAVMNYWVMFNQNPVVDSADLLVVDDAHLAEAALDSLFSVEIDRYAQPLIFEALVRDLSQAFPDYATFQDALTDAPSAAGTELLSFLDQSDFADRFRSLVDSASELRTDTDFRFRWERVRERLHEVNIYCSTRSLWLRPYVYPLRDNSRYGDPEQRLYLSATIGDPHDLARRLGTGPIAKLPLDPQQTVQTYGRRLLILNPDDDADLPARLGLVIAAALHVQPKSVWLCASKPDAEKYRAAVTAWLGSTGLPAGPTWMLSNLGDEIDEFKSAPAGHLFVGGRFDGMDFSADQCRLVVLATQPRAINPQEAFAADYLRDAGFMMQRLNQRIVQALGRCNRAEDDFGVYVLADRRFGAHFGQESRRRGLPANVLAEVDLAENYTELEDDALVSGVTAFLKGDFDQFDRDLAQVAAELPPANAATAPDDSTAEVTAWLELHSRQDYRTAEECFRVRQEACGALGLRELGAFAQWCEAKAAFLEGRRGDAASASRALETLQHAIDRGGATSSWFNRLRSSLFRYRQETAGAAVIDPDDFRVASIQAFDDLLERVGVGLRFERWRGRLTADLTATKHDQYAAALETLGNLLGYTATRPRYGAATDCRWRGVFGNQREAVTWEAKIEHDGITAVYAHAVGQAHNQMSRAEAELGRQGYVVRGTIVTHLEELDPAAAASIGAVKVLRKDAVSALWDRVNELLGIYAGSWSADVPEARLNAADQIAPRLPGTGWLVRVLDAGPTFVDSTALLAEWPA